MPLTPPEEAQRAVPDDGEGPEEFNEVGSKNLLSRTEKIHTSAHYPSVQAEVNFSSLCLSLICHLHIVTVVSPPTKQVAVGANTG